MVETAARPLFRIFSSRWGSIALLAFCTAACAQANARAAAPATAAGEWGGERALLVAGSDGARLSLPCATGVITEPLSLDSQGRFDVAGTVRVHRGMNPGDDSGVTSGAADAVRFTGVVTGDRMTLTIHFRDSHTDDYVLVRGVTARVPLCGSVTPHVSEALS